MAARSLPAAVGVVALLAGCVLLPDGWLGEGEGPPLPGERISVLSLQRSLEPDPGLADLEVRLPRPRINPEWPQAGGRASHAMQHVAVAAAPQQVWRVRLGRGSSRYRRLLVAPVVSGLGIFALDAQGDAVALDVETGERLWRVSLNPADEEDGGYGGGVAVAETAVYAATGFGDVFALDPATGAEIWRRPLGVPIRAAPTYSDGRLFVISYDNKLHALAAADGEVLWAHQGIIEAAGLLGAASPAVAGNIVVAPYSSGELFALRVDNGRVAWSDSLTRTGRLASRAAVSDISGRPIIAGEHVYAVSHGGRMVAINLRNGARVWDQLIDGTQSPWLAGDFIYLVTADAEIVCLWRRNGRVRWVTQLPRYENESSRTGLILWSGPVLASDRLIVVSSSAEALSVSPYSGDILGRLRLPEGARVAPVVAAGTIYILTDDADLIALR